MWRGNQLGRWVSTNVLLEIVGETRYSFCAVEETRPLGDTNVLLLSKISNSSLEVSSEARIPVMLQEALEVQCRPDSIQ